MTKDIYDQHQQAFRHVAAWVILNDDGLLVAKAAFTYSRSGTRTTCYFHVLGTRMERGHANGGGYDKDSASVYAAVQKIAKANGPKSDYAARIEKIAAALKDDGEHWDRALSAAGHRVIQAV